jgi:hypothetical protein
MDGTDYRLIWEALLVAQVHIENEINKGDGLGIFKEELERNELALVALKRNR